MKWLLVWCGASADLCQFTSNFSHYCFCTIGAKIKTGKRPNSVLALLWKVWTLETPRKGLSDLGESADPVLGPTVLNVLGLYHCLFNPFLIVVFLSDCFQLYYKDPMPICAHLTTEDKFLEVKLLVESLKNFTTGSHTALLRSHSLWAGQAWAFLHFSSTSWLHPEWSQRPLMIWESNSEVSPCPLV